MMESRGSSILVINPNTTQEMTDGLIPLIASLQVDPKQTSFDYFTAPSGVPSINNEDDATVSVEHCLPALRDKLASYDGFLVCCYSQHPLVDRLREELTGPENSHKRVVGIFEASIAMCLQLLNVGDKFGIVSTGQQWVDIMDEAIAGLLGVAGSERYAGTETTGFNANELHVAAAEEVSERMKAAAKRLLSKGARAICLGCAGMAGMDVTVRQACIEELGDDQGKRVRIVDGVLSGALFLNGIFAASSF